MPAVVVPVVLIVVLIAFLLGTAAATQRLPQLAPTPPGRFCYWIAASLVGAAAAIATATIWLMVRSMDLLGEASGQGTISVNGIAGGAKSDVLLSGLSELALRCGVVLALAAIVYVLGPPDRRVH